MQLKAEMTNLLEKVEKRPRAKPMQSRLDALAEIDAFVMTHTSLEAKEFFRQLRHLDAWRMLSSFEEKEKTGNSVACWNKGEP